MAVSCRAALLTFAGTCPTEPGATWGLGRGLPTCYRGFKAQFPGPSEGPAGPLGRLAGAGPLPVPQLTPAASLALLLPLITFRRRTGPSVCHLSNSAIILTDMWATPACRLWGANYRAHLIAVPVLANCDGHLLSSVVAFHPATLGLTTPLLPVLPLAFYLWLNDTAPTILGGRRGSACHPWTCPPLPGRACPPLPHMVGRHSRRLRAYRCRYHSCRACYAFSCLS